MNETNIQCNFMTSLPQVEGYNTVKSVGLIYETSVISLERAVNGLVKTAEKMGCNAIVNMHINAGQVYVVYGDGVTVEPKPFSY